MTRRQRTSITFVPISKHISGRLGEVDPMQKFKLDKAQMSTGSGGIYPHIFSHKPSFNWEFFPVMSGFGKSVSVK